ncbi:hypothetical protein C2G38_2181908 [Gigaspora rosea]|uniref:Uncharacterized protein n=1 Tax=Gigaspora rosea TaxID=44941 RepID=A0A397VAA5_9GLOM|nr:hypothetical protein C2G38_2181908 [Gigaspora rosea]
MYNENSNEEDAANFSSISNKKYKKQKKTSDPETSNFQAEEFKHNDSADFFDEYNNLVDIFDEYDNWVNDDMSNEYVNNNISDECNTWLMKIIHLIQSYQIDLIMSQKHQI